MKRRGVVNSYQLFAGGVKHVLRLLQGILGFPPCCLGTSVRLLLSATRGRT